MLRCKTSRSGAGQDWYSCQILEVMYGTSRRPPEQETPIDFSASDRSRQAEWTKSGDMVVDDSEAEQEVIWLFLLSSLCLHSPRRLASSLCSSPTLSFQIPFLSCSALGSLLFDHIQPLRNCLSQPLCSFCAPSGFVLTPKVSEGFAAAFRWHSPDLQPCDHNHFLSTAIRNRRSLQSDGPRCARCASGSSHVGDCT